jgi:hypothetical protein
VSVLYKSNRFAKISIFNEKYYFSIKNRTYELNEIAYDIYLLLQNPMDEASLLMEMNKIYELNDGEEKKICKFLIELEKFAVVKTTRG